MKCVKRDETDPEQVRTTNIEIAVVLEKDEANRGWNEGMEQKKAPGNLE